MSLLTGSSVSAKEHKASGHRTFSVVVHFSTGYRQAIDLGAPGDSAGDLILEEVPLFDAKTGQEVGTGRFDAVKIRVDNGDPLISFDASDKFEDGVIELQGAFRHSEFEKGFSVAIIGGTGAYARARGTGFWKAVDADTLQLTYNVLT
jgi:hypothetical protein